MSTDKQTIENQRFEIFKFADEKKLFFQLLDWRKPALQRKWKSENC